MRRDLSVEFILETLVGLYVVGVVVLCWRRPLLATLLLGGGLAIQVWLWREKADAAMMVAAALLGTPSEILCVRLGVWSYHAPGLVFGIPVWLPLVWASLLCLFRRISLSIHSVILHTWPGRNPVARKLLFGVLGGVILSYYLVTVSVIIRTIALAYTVFMIPAVIFWHGGRDILIFCIGATLGTIGEYICIKLGFWHYHYPFFMAIKVPISLPLAWGLSSVITGRIAGIWDKGKDLELSSG